MWRINTPETIKNSSNDNEIYINAVSNSIKPFIEKASFDKIIFSYHGIPKRQAKKTDETGEHCF